MTNEELIAALRWCPSHGCGRCVALDANGRCTLRGVVGLMHSAADLIEEQAKRIAELEAQLLKEGEWICSYPEIVPNPMFIYGICSICGFEQSISNKLNYCPNCGSRMRKGE